MDEQEQQLLATQKEAQNRESNLDSKGRQHKGEASNMEDLLRESGQAKRIRKIVNATALAD